jgi:uncharacterized protein
MPRPIKWRRVCSLPEYNRFGPSFPKAEQQGVVVMSVDEYETIRLIDYEGMIQEECAKQMNVARTTVQRIYNIARKKLADAIIHNKPLLIEGGEYELCTDRNDEQRCGRCRHRNVRGHSSDL